MQTIKPEKIITTISNLKTGEVYKTEDEWRAKGVPEAEIRRDVKVIMPSLDLFPKTKQCEKMAIIRSKIARQLLAEGGSPRRKGFMFGSGRGSTAEAMSEAAFSPDTFSGFSGDYGGFSSPAGGGESNPPDAVTRGVDNEPSLFQKAKEKFKTFETDSRMERIGRGVLTTPGAIKSVFGFRDVSPELLQTLAEDYTQGGLFSEGLVGGDISLTNAARTFEGLKDLGVDLTGDIRSQVADISRSKFAERFGPKTKGGEGGDSEPIKKLRAPITEAKKEEPKDEFAELLKFYGARFAKGGSTGFEGSPELGGQGTQTEETYGGPPGGDGGDNEPPTVRGGETAPLGVPTFQNLQRHFDNNAKLAEAVRMGLITNEEYNVLGGYDVNQTMGLNPGLTGLGSLAYNVVQSVKGDQPFSEIAGDVGRNIGGAIGLSPGLQSKYESIVGPGSAMMTSLQPFGGPRRFEDGGQVREGYKLGDIVGGIGKVFGKATDAAKKVFKSPIGRAALFATPFLFPSVRTAGIGAARAGKNKFLDFILGKQFVDTGDEVFRSGGINPLTAILGLSALSGLTAKQTEEEDENDVQTVKSDPAFQKLLAYYGGPRRFAQGGDVEDEMLDLGGKEMDLRGGGFVPLGEYEKKDDVPARLSKNEFVFTADAVRAAGGGSVDKGADVMYKTMKTLENKVA